MRDAHREPVVTGMGAVTPFGVGVNALWNGVCAGRSGVDWFDISPDLDPTSYPVRYGGEVKGFNVDDHLQKHCDVRLERSVQMGLVATQEALRQARLLDASDELLDAAMRIEAIVGSAGGAIYELDGCYADFFQRGPRNVSAKSIPKLMFNSLSSNLSIYFGMTGSNFVVASACAAGATAIGLAAILVRHGYADIVLAGGADSYCTPAYLAFWSGLRVLAQNADPKKACRPFDRQRNGMVPGEGAAIVVVESRDSAERRNVLHLATIRGYGSSSDAHHITAPNVVGQICAINCCLTDAGVQPENVDYISAHGTGTKANDDTEAHAIVEVFGARGPAMPVSSVKSMLGHSLGAGGAIEFIVCVEAIRNQFVPPTINCDEPDPAIGLDYVPNIGRAHPVRSAMSNSFGFGGGNAVLLVERTT